MKVKLGKNAPNTQVDVVDGRVRLTGLRAASVYQVMIATENSFGLSIPQNIFTFATRGAGQTSEGESDF